MLYKVVYILLFLVFARSANWFNPYAQITGMPWFAMKGQRMCPNNHVGNLMLIQQSNKILKVLI